MRLQLLTCDYGVRAMKSKLGTSNGGRLSLLSGGGRAVARPQLCHTHVAQPGACDHNRRCCCETLVNIQEAIALKLRVEFAGLVGREKLNPHFNVLQQKTVIKKKRFSLITF